MKVRHEVETGPSPGRVRAARLRRLQPFECARINEFGSTLGVIVLGADYACDAAPV